MILILRNAFSSLASEIRSLWFNFFQCTLGKALVRSCGFITLPLLTFYFTKEEMGVYQLLVGGLAIFVELASLGTRQYLWVEYFKFSNLYSRTVLILRQLWVALCFTSVLFVTACAILMTQFDYFYWPVFILMFAQSYVNIFNELYLTFFQLRMKYARYNLLSFLLALSQMGTVVLTLTLLHFKLTGLVFGLLSANLLFFVFVVFSSKRYLKILYRLSRIKKGNFRSVVLLLKKSLLFLPPTLSFWLLVNIDQWMLGTMSGVADVGIYSFAGKFPLFFDYILSSTLILVYTPRLYHRLREQYRQGCEKNMLNALAVVVVGVLGYPLIGFLLPLGKYLISPNFYESLNYIPLLIFAAILRLATHLLQLTIRFEKFTGFIFWSNLFCALIDAVLNYFWIPKFGIMGCVYATVTSFAVMFFVNAFFHHYLSRLEEMQRGIKVAG